MGIQSLTLAHVRAVNPILGSEESDESGAGTPFEQFLDRIVNRPRTTKPKSKPSRCTAERLESRLLLTTDTWRLAISGDWDTPGDWSTGLVPNATEDVVISHPGTYTITHSLSNADSFNSLSSSLTTVEIDLTAGSLTQLGATAPASTVKGTFTVSGGATLAVEGGTFTASGATTLSGANLTAVSGGQLLFPDATSYIGSNVANTAISATGVGSLISLTALTTFNGGGAEAPYYFATSVLPTSGGEIDLAGAVNSNGNANIITLDNTGGKLGVTGITSMANTNLTDTGGESLSFTKLTSLTADNLSVSGGSQLLFPDATSYTGNNGANNSILATGSTSLISLTALTTFNGGGAEAPYYFATSVLPTNGGEIDLAGAINSNGNANIITLDNTGGKLGVTGITSMANTNLTDTGGESLSFTKLTSLTADNLSVSGGSQLLFPDATSYTGNNGANNSILATGSTSLISLTALTTFNGGGAEAPYYFATSVLPTNGGEIDLAGAINSNGNANIITLDNTGGKLGVTGITSMANTNLTDTGGESLSFTKLTSLTADNLSVSGGSQLLFPDATSYTGNNGANNSILATGPTSLISLTALTTFDGGGAEAPYYFATSVLPTNGGEIDLAGAINSNGNANIITLDNTGGKLGVTGITSMANTNLTDMGGESLSFTKLTSLMADNLQASGGSQLLFPHATSYTGNNGANNSILATGSTSLISLPALLTFAGGGSEAPYYFTTTITASSGGEVDISGQITGAVQFTSSGGGIISTTGSGGLSSLTVSGPGSVFKLNPGAKIYTVTSLSVTGGATLDLTNNELLINYGGGADPIGSIAAEIATGYNAGAWNGTGIISSTARTNPSYALGYADSADPNNPANLAANQIEIMYTLQGDANLDAKVNGTDFNLMAAAFNQAIVNAWDYGDFNYDGKVNGTDFVLMADNFNQFASQSALATASSSANAASTGATQATTSSSSSDSNDVAGTVLGKQKKPKHGGKS